jgi:RNA polymerase sigma factor (sigma-70 family)
MQLDSNTGVGSSLESLILSCVEPVERMAYKYCGHSSNHEDFVSLGILNICEVAQRAQVSASDPSAYLCRVAQNAMIDEYRRLHRLSLVSLDAPLSDESAFTLHDVLPVLVPAAPAVPVSKRSQALNGAIRRLSSARQRAALRRRYGLPGYGAHTLNETARALRSSSNNAAKLAASRWCRNLQRDPLLCRQVLGVN